MLVELTAFEIQLRDQILRNWKNYNPKRIDLGIARDKQQLDIAGKYLCVQNISSADAAVTIILNDKDNGELDLVDGLEIETLFRKVFITNAAQADEWIDIIFGADFRYKKTGQGVATGGGGGTGATEAQQVLNLTHANPDTSVQAAANTCIEAIIKADVNNTGISWIDFGAAAVQNSCVPLDPGEWIKEPITNTNRIYANFEVGGEIVYIAYAT